MLPDIVQKLIGLGLPILGTALLGPFGGAAAGVIAKALGLSDSSVASIDGALASANEVTIQKLKSAEAEYVAMIQAQAQVAVASSQNVASTMQAELINDRPGAFGIFQRGWRPAFAWELLGECTVMAFIMAHEVWTQDFKTLSAMMDFQGFLTFYYGMRFGVLGVFGLGRSAEKVAAIGAGDGAPDEGLLQKLLAKLR